MSEPKVVLLTGASSGFGIETTIAVPGSFTSGTNRFANAGHAADDAVEDVFRVGDRVRKWFYQRIGLADLLNVSSSATPKSIGS